MSLKKSFTTENKLVNKKNYSVYKNLMEKLGKYSNNYAMNNYHTHQRAFNNDWEIEE